MHKNPYDTFFRRQTIPAHENTVISSRNNRTSLHGAYRMRKELSTLQRPQNSSLLHQRSMQHRPNHIHAQYKPQLISSRIPKSSMPESPKVQLPGHDTEEKQNSIMRSGTLTGSNSTGKIKQGTSTPRLQRLVPQNDIKAVHAIKTGGSDLSMANSMELRFASSRGKASRH